MATIRAFEDLEIWQLARELSKTVYALTLRAPFAKDYSLRDQANRSSGSIMDNIAEGFERGGSREFIQFLSIARGSAAELKSQLYRAHVNDEEFQALKDKCILIAKKMNSFVVYLRDSDFKGMKFHEPEENYGIEP